VGGVERRQRFEDPSIVTRSGMTGISAPKPLCGLCDVRFGVGRR
jgi:hypothetical protein